MKVIVLTAGLGTRLRPHTYSRPKPLLSVAGKPVIAHILDPLAESLQIDELICVYGYLGEQIEAFLEDRYEFPVRFVNQENPKGQAHAIHLCKELVSGPTLIVFGDGLFGVDLAELNQHPQHGLVYVKEVDDPRRFGIAVVEDGRITRLVEKPDDPISNLAVIGVYYLPEVNRLMEAIEHCMAENIQTKGEYYLADALAIMLDRGEHLVPVTVSMWQDAGTVPALLDTHRYLLDHGHDRAGDSHESTIIPPVHLAEGVTIERSVVGPYVSVGAGAVIRNTIISDTIVNEQAHVEGVFVQQSLIGEQAQVVGGARELNIGDTSQLKIG